MKLSQCFGRLTLAMLLALPSLAQAAATAPAAPRPNFLLILADDCTYNELYETSADPYELKNLAAEPQLAATKARLSVELERWMKAQGDPGIPLDTPEALEAARRGEHKFFPHP